MDELLYGTLHSTTVDYSLQQQQQQQQAALGNMVSWGSYQKNNNNIVAYGGGHGVWNIPAVYGSDQIGSGNNSSSSSDAASSLMVAVAVAEIQRNNTITSEEQVSNAIRAQIASHPLYPKLLQAYIDCQKVLNTLKCHCNLLSRADNNLPTVFVRLLCFFNLFYL